MFSLKLFRLKTPVNPKNSKNAKKKAGKVETERESLFLASFI